MQIDLQEKLFILTDCAAAVVGDFKGNKAEKFVLVGLPLSWEKIDLCQVEKKLRPNTIRRYEENSHEFPPHVLNKTAWIGPVFSLHGLTLATVCLLCQPSQLPFPFPSALSSTEADSLEKFCSIEKLRPVENCLR